VSFIVCALYINKIEFKNIKNIEINESMKKSHPDLTLHNIVDSFFGYLKITYSSLIVVAETINCLIARWRLEVGSRKRPSYSEILERRWRHTLQA
jgi:hypothetical protein